MRERRLFNKIVKTLLQALFVHGVVPNFERSSNQNGLHLQKDQKGPFLIATLMYILKTTPQNPNNTLFDFLAMIRNISKGQDLSLCFVIPSKLLHLY